jgi:hypothetical protein
MRRSTALRAAVRRLPWRESTNGSGANGSVMKDHVMMRRFVAVEALFNGRHFDRQIIILCVSWYTSFKLSFRW